LAIIGGVGSFALAKYDIDKRRKEAMKVRERIKKSNQGEYTPERKF